MPVAVMTRQDALGWVGWVASHRDAALMCSLTVDQYKEGAEEATALAMVLERGKRGPVREARALIAEQARRARNNVGIVVALDTLGFNTVGEAASALAEELGLGTGEG